jgi:glucosamine--fructose-6-phosphate aminotransferase (isomerizing)
MYDTMATQPAVLADRLGCGWDQAEAAALHLQDRSRIFLVGIGSSLHVAMAGEGWLRKLAGVDAWAVPSLEFVLDGPDLRAGDAVIVISHSGGGGYTRDSLHRAQAAGVPVLTLTGEQSAMPPSDLNLTTSPQELCKCHTVGYAAALLVMVQVATALAEKLGKPVPPDWQHHLKAIPDLMTQQLAGDMTEIKAWATDLVATRTVIAIGGGLHQATADEVALKIQEAVHKPVLSMTVEQLAHGPMAALSRGDVVLSLLPPGAPALARQEQVAAGLAELGIPVFGLGTGSRQIPAPESHEWLAPLTHLVPWQLLTYWYAVAAGVDPDWNRLNETAHAAAKSHY